MFPPKHFIKSTGWNINCVSIPPGTSGSQSIILNWCFATVRNVIYLHVEQIKKLISSLSLMAEHIKLA